MGVMGVSGSYGSYGNYNVNLRRVNTNMGNLLEMGSFKYPSVESGIGWKIGCIIFWPGRFERNKEISLDGL